MKKIFVALLLLPAFAQAQLGGSYSFAFLKLPNNARVASLGGTLNCIADEDVGQAWQNPALINAEMNNRISFNTVNYLSDINHGSAAFAHSFKKYGNMAAGIQYVNYGSFKGYDENGNATANFSAGEQCYYAGYSYQYLKTLTVGATVKYIMSTLETYHATGLAADIGFHWKRKDSIVNAALVFKNIGTMLNGYSSPQNKEPLPYEVQAGISIKPRHMPIRFSIMGANLQTKNTAFLNPNKAKTISLDSGVEIEEKVTISQNIFTHLTFGAEFILGKSLFLRFGYNPRTSREMKLTDVRSFSGFSWGLGLKIKRFSFSYGNVKIFAGQNSNLFSMTLSLDKMKWSIPKKK
ncbi:MAG: type IX secretion system protein PorQ [Flavobacteriaceae bacterium]|nr:type IX secretion system protein PorQ [Flavobacteriaceae bacterium]